MLFRWNGKLRLNYFSQQEEDTMVRISILINDRPSVYRSPCTDILYRSFMHNERSFGTFFGVSEYLPEQLVMTFIIQLLSNITT